MKEIIYYESDEAAKKVTTEVWVSRRGNVFKGEHYARYDGCTHTKCKSCSAYCDKTYTNCSECREKIYSDKYDKMPLIEWDGKTPLMLHDGDEFFQNEEDVLEFCYGNDLKPEDLKLVVCVPQYAHELDPYDYYNDILPKDMTLEDVAPDLVAAFDCLNEKIRNYKKPLSWTYGKYRTSLHVKQA